MYYIILDNILLISKKYIGHFITVDKYDRSNKKGDIYMGDIKRRFSILYRYDRNKHGNIGTTTGFVMQAAVTVDILVPIIDSVFPA